MLVKPQQFTGTLTILRPFYKYTSFILGGMGMGTRLGMGMRMVTGMLIEMGLGSVLGTPQAFSVSYIIWF